MGNLYVRIDDRLIHGQIVTAWCKTLGIDRIIAVDDLLATNEMMKSIMTMGVPKHIQAEIADSKMASDRLKDTFAGNTLLIARFARNLRILEEELSSSQVINLGNCSKQDNAVFTSKGIGVGGMISLTAEDVDVLDCFESRGIKVTNQQVPTDKEVLWRDLKRNQ